MESSTSKERLLLVVADMPSAGPLAAVLRNLPYLSSLADRGARARVKPPAAGLSAWPTLATGATQQAETLEENAVFWRLLTNKGRRVVLSNAVANGAGVKDGAQDWDLQIVKYHCQAESGGPLRHWQEWDKTLASLGMATGLQTAVMALNLPSAAGDGVLVAGGSFIAKIGDLGTMSLLDLAPTILWLLDVAPAKHMTGRVWDELWRPEAGWNEEEQQALFQHLKGLGYLG